MVCIRCQKRPAIIFVQRMENGQMKNEGYCLHCARELHIKPVEDLMKQFGMSDEDMDNMENRMESMMDEMGDANPLSLMMNMGQPMGGEENEGDDDLVPGSSATFPLGVKAEGDAGNSKKGQKNFLVDLLRLLGINLLDELSGNSGVDTARLDDRLA